MKDFYLSQKDLLIVLQNVAVGMKQHIDELRDLDAALGDGDLGVTMELGAQAILAFMSTPVEADTGRMLAKLGMDINKVNPSTFGTLLASAFMGAGKAVQNKTDLNRDDLVLMGNGAIEAIKRRGKAEVGDKTMLDALSPAVEALRTGLSQQLGIIQILHNAVQASQQGVNATTGMKAKFGRVSWRPDGGLGLKDGGAAAMHFIIVSFIAGLIEIIEQRNHVEST